MSFSSLIIVIECFLIISIANFLRNVYLDFFLPHRDIKVNNPPHHPTYNDEDQKNNLE